MHIMHIDPVRNIDRTGIADHERTTYLSQTFIRERLRYDLRSDTGRVSDGDCDSWKVVGVKLIAGCEHPPSRSVRIVVHILRLEHVFYTMLWQKNIWSILAIDLQCVEVVPLDRPDDLLAVFENDHH